MFPRIARVAVAAIFLLWGVPTASALTFNITNLGGATPQMLTGFAQAGQMWSAAYNDPITINVRINAAALPVGQIGGTSAFFDPYPYSDVRTALLADRLSADDISSTNNLQAGSVFSMLINRTANNPSGLVSATPYFDTGLGGSGQAGPENNSTVRITSANAKALGLIAGNGAGLDGTITFSTLQSFDFDRSNGINGAQVDFVGVAVHELGHLLGFMSGTDVLDRNASAPGLNDNQLQFVTPLDLFRFSSRSIGGGGGIGVPDFTADNTTKYLSVDGGTTPIVNFSNGSVFGDGFESHHWKNNLGLGIMDPTASIGELLAISSNDQRAFDVIGYDLSSLSSIAVPEPSTSALFGLAGLAGFACSRGRSRFKRRRKSER